MLQAKMVKWKFLSCPTQRKQRHGKICRHASDLWLHGENKRHGLRSVNTKLKVVGNRLTEVKIIQMKKYGYRCHEVGGSALTVCVLMATRANSILVKGSANLLSFHTTRFNKVARHYIYTVICNMVSLTVQFPGLLILTSVKHSCCITGWYVLTNHYY